VRKALVLSLCMMLLFAGLIATGQKRSQSTKRLRNKLETVRDARQDAIEKLRRTKKEVKAVAGDIAKVDERLGSVNDQLEETTIKLDTGQVEQKRLAGELEVATKELDSTRELVIDHLETMYMYQRENVLEALLTSKSLSQVAERKFVFQEIAEQDRELMGDFKKAFETVATKKKRTDELVAEIARLAAYQEEKQQELEIVREAKSEALADLRDQQDKLEDLVRQLDAEENSIEAQIAAYNRRVATGGAVKLPAFTGRFSRPVNARMGSGFGMRFHPILKRNRMHKGIDFAAKHGAPIYAAAGGVVISASYGRGYGNHVIIDHGGGISTLYAHCSRMSVSSGQRVKRGQAIAAVGSTGLSTGPHLHWEVRVNGQAVNPMGRF
jgi:murein DD-endopeptidase MepM/ murein hydrolase activator NlpD